MASFHDVIISVTPKAETVTVCVCVCREFFKPFLFSDKAVPHLGKKMKPR